MLSYRRRLATATISRARGSPLPSDVPISTGTFNVVRGTRHRLTMGHIEVAKEIAIRLR